MFPGRPVPVKRVGSLAGGYSVRGATLAPCKETRANKSHVSLSRIIAKVAVNVS